MGFFEKLFNRAIKNSESVDIRVDKTNISTCRELNCNMDSLEYIGKKYIVFDVESTGLNPAIDRIIELGAAYYENGTCIKEFSSLINIHSHIPSAASKVNNITDQMIAKAPEAKDVYRDFISFIGDEALQGKIVFLGYNVSFDMNFLIAELNRINVNATLVSFDVMKFAKKLLDLSSYKQVCVADHFKIATGNAHRALDDAKTCANIYTALLSINERKINVARIKPTSNEQYVLTPEDIEYCAVIDKILKDNDVKSYYLRYKKFSDGAISANILYKFIYIKRNTKGTYLVLPKDSVLTEKFIIAPATKSEGGEEKIRAYFSSPLDLFDLSKLITERFIEHDKYRKDYMNSSKRATKEAEELMDEMFILSDTEAASAIERAYSKTYPPIQLQKPKKETIEPKKKELKEKTAPTTRDDKGTDELELPPIKQSSVTSAGGKKPIYQMDDDGNVVKEFESIADAVKETGVSSKCIRDAAKGVQKHAGGYVWRYK